MAGATGGAVANGELSSIVIGGLLGGIVGVFNPFASKEAGTIGGLAIEGVISTTSNLIGQGVGNLFSFAKGQCSSGLNALSAIGSGIGTIAGGGLIKPFKLDKFSEGVTSGFFTGAGERLGNDVTKQLAPK